MCAMSLLGRDMPTNLAHEAFLQSEGPHDNSTKESHVKKQLNACKRVDVVWDTYIAWSQPGRNKAKEYD